MSPEAETRLLAILSPGVGAFALFVHRPWWGGVAMLASLLVSKAFRLFSRHG